MTWLCSSVSGGAVVAGRSLEDHEKLPGEMDLSASGRRLSFTGMKTLSRSVRELWSWVVRDLGGRSSSLNQRSPILVRVRTRRSAEAQVLPNPPNPHTRLDPTPHTPTPWTTSLLTPTPSPALPACRMGASPTLWRVSRPNISLENFGKLPGDFRNAIRKRARSASHPSVPAAAGSGTGNGTGAAIANAASTAQSMAPQFSLQKVGTGRTGEQWPNGVDDVVDLLVKG